MNSLTIERENGVAVISLDAKGKSLNVLTPGVLSDIKECFAALKDDREVKAAVFMSGKPGSFIAGMDVAEIEALMDPEEALENVKTGQSVNDFVDSMPFPVVCAIDGVCLGGGLELALACDYRIATDNPKTTMGFPEVLLGIFPGFGGSQRMPRLVGLQTALDMILTGRNYVAKKAFRAGLVDSIVPAEYLRREAVKLALDAAEGNTGKLLAARKKKRGGIVRLLLEKNPFGRKLLFSMAKKNVLKATGGNYPAPLKALEAVRRGTRKSLEEGLRIEAAYVAELAVSGESKNLISVYHLRERAKRTSVLPDAGLNDVKKAAVLGAGVMGGGIAHLLADRGIDVRLKDINNEALGLGLRSAQKLFGKAVRRRKITRLERDRRMSLISPTLEYSGFRHADIVIEAVVEKMDVKKAVLAEVEGLLGNDAVIASNTSALSISELATAAKTPERVVGMHFFNPVHRMPLVEVIKGAMSSDRAVEAVLRLSRRLKKTSILVKDSPGFLVNRLLLVYLNEACHMFTEGIDTQSADRTMLNFGMPMGPFRLMDEVGLDIAYHAAGVMAEGFNERMDPSPLLELMHGDGLLGKKGGLGFYDYSGKKATYNLKMEKYRSGATKKTDPSVKRLVYPMISEAALCLSEGIVETPEDIDTGMIFGTGFPPFRGGLLRYADETGIASVVRSLESLAETYGERLKPSVPLLELAREGRSFYS